MNEFQLLSTQSLRNVGQNENEPLHKYLRNLRRLHGSLRLGPNMSCGDPTLSILLHPENKTLVM